MRLYKRTLLWFLFSILIPIHAFSKSNPKWLDERTPINPKGFVRHSLPEKLTYRMGWSGIEVGSGTFMYSYPDSNTIQLVADVHTLGLARSLWKLDATLLSTVDNTSLLPKHFTLEEEYKKATRKSEVTFYPEYLIRKLEKSEKSSQKPKRYHFSSVFDLGSALLFLQSQPLKQGDMVKLLVFPGNRPYLATITVGARETINVAAGYFPAIRMDLKLQKVEKDGTLVPHSKFRRTTGWISDDNHRYLLKLDGEVFIGSVFCELTSVSE